MARLEVLRDFADETLEGELADEELGRLLVAPNFTEGDSSGPEAMGLLDAAGCGLDRNKNGESANRTKQTTQGLFGSGGAWKPAAHAATSRPGPPGLQHKHSPPSPSSWPASWRAAYAGPCLCRECVFSICLTFMAMARAPKNRYPPPVDLRAVCC